MRRARAFDSCRYDFTRDIDIIPENEQNTLLLRGSIGFGQAKEHVVSLEYLRAENEVITRIAPPPTNLFIPATSPFFPVGAPIYSGPRIRRRRGCQLARSACRQAFEP